MVELPYKSLIALFYSLETDLHYKKITFVKISLNNYVGGAYLIISMVLKFA